MSICDTKINWKRGTNDTSRSMASGLFIRRKSFFQISVMVAGDCWPSRLFLPGWQTAKYNAVFRCYWFIVSETSLKATEAKTPSSQPWTLMVDGPGCKSHSGHLKNGRWGWGEGVKKKKMEWKRRWQMITYFVSCTSSPRRALMWIIKCKLPGVICHVARRTQGVSNSEQMLLSTSPAKKNLSCGSQFPLLLLVPDGQIGATPFSWRQKKNTFVHVLIAF